MLLIVPFAVAVFLVLVGAEGVFTAGITSALVSAAFTIIFILSDGADAHHANTKNVGLSSSTGECDSGGAIRSHIFGLVCEATGLRMVSKKSEDTIRRITDLENELRYQRELFTMGIVSGSIVSEPLYIPAGAENSHLLNPTTQRMLAYRNPRELES